MMKFTISGGNILSRKFNIIKLVKRTQWTEPLGERTDINIYNCITKSKVPLIIENSPFIRWYSCGPTVYDSAHIGHACTYVRLDVIQRILKYFFNYNIVTVTNITDIDDKIIKKCMGSSFQPLVKRYETEFWNDMKKFGIDQPNIVCRVTESIPQIISFITQLICNDKAYATDKGNVYFSIAKSINYGKLQNIGHDVNLIDVIDDDKRAPEDFALWKAAKIDEPFWKSPWGNGRPGWHIECSVMASIIFGDKIDIHAGGLDLKFPHHENEEALSCSYHKSNQWVNYWLHTGSLTLTNAEKMSKSLKNTISIDKLLETYTANEFRMACLITHYRRSIEYSDDRMKTARAILNKFITFSEHCEQLKRDKIFKCTQQNRIQMEIALKRTYCAIKEALQDDFDTPKVLNDLINLMTLTINTFNDPEVVDTSNLHTNIDILLSVENLVNRILSIFGISDEQFLENSKLDVSRFENILNCSTEFRFDVRQVAKTTANGPLFKLCDQFRNNLLEHGIHIKDEINKSKWFDSKKII